MRRLIPAAVLLLVVFTILPGLATDKAKSVYEKGEDAEARQNYEEAYEFFKQAYDLKPKDLRFRTAYERNKFLAASSHVHRGQILRDEHKLVEARDALRSCASVGCPAIVQNDCAGWLAEPTSRSSTLCIRIQASRPWWASICATCATSSYWSRSTTWPSSI